MFTSVNRTRFTSVARAVLPLGVVRKASESRPTQLEMLRRDVRRDVRRDAVLWGQPV
jgi:hypothetical protein